MKNEKEQFKQEAWIQHLKGKHKESIESANRLIDKISKKSLGKMLKEARVEKGLTLEEVLLISGGRITISRSSLSAIENGRQEIRGRHLIYLMKLYGINEDIS